MGRGRSKAKQTKVARDLKYSNQDMDLERLAKELHGELDLNDKSQEKALDNKDDYKNWIYFAVNRNSIIYQLVPLL